MYTIFKSLNKFIKIDSEDFNNVEKYFYIKSNNIYNKKKSAY